MNNQHYASILEINYYLSVYDMYFKLYLLSKIYFFIDPIFSLNTKI